MPKVHGKNSKFSADNAAGTLVDLSPWIQTVDWPQAADSAEDTTMGQGAKTFSMGLKDGGEVKIEGLYDAATGGPDGTLAGTLGQEATTTVQWQPNGAGAGKVQYAAEALHVSYGTSSEFGGMVKFGSTWRVTGAVTRTVLV